MGKKSKDFPFPPKIRNFPFLVVIFQWKQKNYVLHFLKILVQHFQKVFVLHFVKVFMLNFFEILVLLYMS